MSEMPSPPVLWDLELIRERLPMPEFCTGRLGMELRPAGRNFVGRCPVHGEKTPSFKVEQGKNGWWCKCFGCELKGDIFALFMATQGISNFGEAAAQLAGMAGLAPRPAGSRPLKIKKPAPPPQVRDAATVLPPLRNLSVTTCTELAILRGLRPAGVQAAAAAGLVRGQTFALSRNKAAGHRGLVWGEEMEREGEAGSLRVNPVRCWAVTDPAGVCAQVRRLDGRGWPKYDGGEIKAWTIGTSTWPIGALEIGPRSGVVLVEGGPDLLAAYHFLTAAGLTGKIAVVAVLGASVNLREDALLRFMGKKVLILPHTDRLNERTGRQAGFHAAARWAANLRESWGVPVEQYRLPLPDGTVGDLNDAARHRCADSATKTPQEAPGLAAAVAARLGEFAATLTENEF